jgi:hypothetical protein
MNNYKISEKFESVKPEQVFDAGRASFADLEMEIVKDRSFALLLQTRLTGNDVINANFIVNGFQNEFTLTLTSETADQEALQELAERFVERLNQQLTEQ